MADYTNYRESKIETKAVEFAEGAGIVCLKLNIGGGWPDRLLLGKGAAHLFIEFKRLNADPRRLQDFRLKTLRRLGFNAITVDTIEEAKEEIKKHFYHHFK